MQHEKKVSVIMGIYNQWDTEVLKDAVDSILCQTLNDFEFIIYDDGSDPQIGQYIRSLSKLDPRIVLIGMRQNHGLAFSLNACIDIAQGKYIARMDADDISLPERLERQYEFMEEHPEYAWCGCNAYLFDENGRWGERQMPYMPESSDYLRFSPYIHPSVMYRREIFHQAGKYSVSRETLRCEDYEIFMRLHQMGYRGCNIQQNLFCYREDPESYKKRTMRCRLNEMKIRYHNFAKMNMLFPVGWLYVVRPVFAGLLPAGVIACIKRRMYENKRTEKSASVQRHLKGNANLLGNK